MAEKILEQFTKYEIARILGARALQLSMNAPILIKLSKEQLEKLKFDSIKIAEEEFSLGVLPISVKRPLPKRFEAEIKKIKVVVEPKKEDKKIEEKEGEEEKEIQEEGEIMELAQPEDEVEEEPAEEAEA